MATQALITRRTLAATLAAAIPAAAGAAPATPAVGNPDGELIRLHELWKTKVASFNACTDLSEEEWERMGGENAELEHRIYAMPAKTLHGLRIKTEMARQYVPSCVSEDGLLLDDVAFKSLFDTIEQLAAEVAA